MGTEAMSPSVGGLRRVSVLVMAAGALLAACGGGGDGSVGVGSGQDPDPVALDFPVAYTKGPLLDDQMQMQQSPDLRELLRFNVGTDLYVRDRASPTAVDRNVTFTETQGAGDVMGLDISADGSKVLFAMRGPFDPNLALEDQPSWNVWEYEIASQTLRRIIVSDITAEAGQDIWPRYLPDGRILFVSTRQRQAKAILLDEGKPQFDALVDHGRQENRDDPAFVLHVMNDDGSDIHQISLNQSHDMAPSVLSNGQVLFSRWDHAGGNDGVHLYRANPDGTGLELLYGAESHLTGTNGTEIEFINAREMPDGRIMAVLRPFDQPELGGDVAIIDTPVYVENTQPTAPNQGLMGPAQISATTNQVRTDNAPSPGGRFSDAFPLWDGTGRVLVSWAICRLIENNVIVPCDAQGLADPNAQSAPPFYGIWMYDPVAQTQLPVVTGEEGMLIGEIVAAQPRALPQSIPDKVPGVDLDADLVAENVGILDIRSVYDIDGVDTANPDIATLADPAQRTAVQRPARFLRIEKAVSIPNRDVRDFDASAFGVNASQGMREILGYAPIEPDGSVRVKVPANVAFGVSVLDANGRRISQRHQNWMQLMPGEERSCNGCHSTASGLSHGRDDAFDSAYVGATTTGQPFPNTDAAIFADFGETMAEARTRISCATDCAVLVPSVDVVYDDVWTDETAAGRARDASFAYRYVDLDTPPPTSLACLGTWSAACRIVINYEQHIHPLWGLARQELDTDGVTVVADHTCTQGGCHAPIDAMNNVDVPKGQLDLTDGPSTQVPEQFNAYRELLAPDIAVEVVNGALQPIVIDVGPDADGNPILVNVPVTPPMSTAGANASSAFFDRFAPGSGDAVHEGILSSAELRLIAEWLDIGGQYYNNPFDAPVN